VKMLSSSNEYTIPAEGEKLEFWLPTAPSPTVDTRLLCALYSDSLLDMLNSVNASGTCYASMIPLRVAARRGLDAVLAAHHTAYLAYTRGALIARRKGVDTLLYLLGVRSIRDALREGAPSNGEHVLILATPAHCAGPLLGGGNRVALSQCTVRGSTRLEVTATACFVIEARVYRQRQTSSKKH